MPSRKNQKDTNELQININDFNLNFILNNKNHQKIATNPTIKKPATTIKKPTTTIKKPATTTYNLPSITQADPKHCLVCYSEENEMINLGCNHSICSLCACRLFYLMKDRRCPICKQDSTVNPSKHLLILKCQTCDYIAKTTPQLIHHYKKHNTVLCELCIENKHEFPFEYSLYSIDKLLKHKALGTKEDNSNGFYGHILCTFCNKFTYDADSCKRHCRIAHCLCTVCESAGIRHNYYRCIEDLNLHCSEVHYVCCFNQCNGLVFCYQSALDEHLYKIHNVGNGSININTVGKKDSSLKVMCPYEIEKNNKENAKSNKPVEKQKRKIVQKRIVEKEYNRQDGSVPECFNRHNENSELKQSNSEYNFIKNAYKDLHNELFQRSKKYQRREITPQMFIECIHLLLGKSETLKFANSVIKYYNEESKNMLLSYLEEYKGINHQQIENTTVEDIIETVQPKKVERKLKFKLFEIRKK